MKNKIEDNREEQRKTLRDYLLEGGIKGKFFHGCFGYNPSIKCIYEVINLNVARNWNDRVFIDIKEVCSDHSSLFVRDRALLSECFLNIEATSEEVQRAKEGILVQKA